jgi:hypothetical protein
MSLSLLNGLELAAIAIVDALGQNGEVDCLERLRAAINMQILHAQQIQQQQQQQRMQVDTIDPAPPRPAASAAVVSAAPMAAASAVVIPALQSLPQVPFPVAGSAQAPVPPQPPGFVLSSAPPFRAPTAIAVPVASNSAAAAAVAAGFQLYRVRVDNGKDLVRATTSAWALHVVEGQGGALHLLVEYNPTTNKVRMPGTTEPVWDRPKLSEALRPVFGTNLKSKDFSLGTNKMEPAVVKEGKDGAPQLVLRSKKRKIEVDDEPQQASSSSSASTAAAAAAAAAVPGSSAMPYNPLASPLDQHLPSNQSPRSPSGLASQAFDVGSFDYIVKLCCMY